MKGFEYMAHWTNYFDHYYSDFSFYLFVFAIFYRQWELEPDNLGGNEQCAMMYNSGVFTDKPCNSLAYYVCQTSQKGNIFNMFRKGFKVSILNQND